MPGPGRGRRTSMTVSARLLGREGRRVKVLVIGATGELGQQVAAALTGREGVELRLARRPRPGWESRAPIADMVFADLRDPASLDEACAGVHRMFLVSSPTQDQVELETNGIEAAERAGVERIVKISNIPIPGLETGLHGNHRTIERRLAASTCAATIVQPSFFANVIDKQSDVVAGGHVVLPTGSGKIAWIQP